jgi:hypothetical protein
MKTKKLISKVSRYLVLSKEFEQDVEDLFEERAVEAIDATCSGTLNLSSSGSYYSGSTSIQGSTCHSGVVGKTRSEVIIDKALKEANRSDRYDEYKNLQESLGEYVKFYTKE